MSDGGLSLIVLQECTASNPRKGENKSSVLNQITHYQILNRIFLARFPQQYRVASYGCLLCGKTTWSSANNPRH